MGWLGLNVEDYRLYNNGMTSKREEADGNGGGGRKLHHTFIPVSIHSLSQCYDDDDNLYSAHAHILIPFNDTSTLCAFPPKLIPNFPLHRFHCAPLERDKLLFSH
jgi:hypothetical protein